MPQRNTIRSYVSGGFYHVYNRGVEKRVIFIDNRDHYYFQSLLMAYLTPALPIEIRLGKRPEAWWRDKLKPNEVELLAYCLMPNHFHLLLKQNSSNGITKFIRRVANAYVAYFNKKHERAGALFQGKFKAVLVETDEYLLHLSRYIHRNPLEVGPLTQLQHYPYSSYSDYLRLEGRPWIHKEEIMKFFNHQTSWYTLIKKAYQSYQEFVEDKKLDSEYALGELTLDNEEMLEVGPLTFKRKQLLS